MHPATYRLSAVLAVMVLGGGGAAAQAPVREAFVLTPTQAFVLLPPAVVAAPVVRLASWSSDGRYVLSVREHAPAVNLPAPGRPAAGPAERAGPQPVLSLVVWDARAQRSREVWTTTVPAAQIAQLYWLPRSDVALALAWAPAAPGPAASPVPEHVVLRVAASAGRAERLGARELADLAPGCSLSPSPTQPLALLTSVVTPPQPTGDLRLVFRGIQEDGRLTAPATLKDRELLETGWSADGQRAYLRCRPLPAGGPAPALVEWYAMDPRSGRLSSLAAAPELHHPGRDDRPLRLVAARSLLRDGAAAVGLSPLWLEGTAPPVGARALVCADAELGQLSPRGDAVLYVAQGAAFVAAVRSIPRSTFTAARQVASQQVAVSEAKQVGLALLRYTDDHDGALPQAGAPLIDLLGPYLGGNPSLLDGFVYTYPGGALAAIEQPSATSLGAVAGPGGQAVVYADGHVTWEPSAPGAGPP
jgi:hypothetical protein